MTRKLRLEVNIRKAITAGFPVKLNKRVMERKLR